MADWRRRTHALAGALAGAVLAVSGCSAGSPAATSSTAPATPSEPASTPQATPTLLPSASPRATPQPLAALVLRITHDYFGSQWTTTSLVADGRLTSPAESGYQVRVLSPIGIDRVRSEILGTGLFEESATVPLVLVADADPGCTDGLGLSWGVTIELATNAGGVNVSWEEARAERACYEPSAQRDGLEALLVRLESMEEWLPSEAWSDATARAYQPHGYRMFTIALPWQNEVGQPPDLATVEWPLTGTLTSYGTGLALPPWRDSWTMRCAAVTGGEAILVVDALADAGAAMTDSTPSGYASATYLGDRSNGLTIALVLEALRPDETDCGNPDLGFLNCWSVGGVNLFDCAMP